MSLPEIRLIGVLICAIIAAAMIVYMKKSRMGQAIRATAQDPRAAKVMGMEDYVPSFLKHKEEEED